MEFRPAKKQLYVWLIIAGLFGAAIFASGFVPAFLGKQMFNLPPASVQAVDAFIIFFSIMVAVVFGVLMVLIFLHYTSVNYSILKDRVVITMDFPAKKEKVIPYNEIVDVEEHQNLLEKPFGLVHLVMKRKGKQGLIDKLFWGWDTMPGIIIKEGIKKELTKRIVRA